jgi:hypothetical protein
VAIAKGVTPTEREQPDLPHGATGARGHRRADPGAGDEGEEELVVVRGWSRRSEARD